MLDFTSALYLGIHHESDCLDAWPQFTTGKPAALEEAAEARPLAQAVAQLQGLEAAVVAPSTLHLAWDVFLTLARTHSIEVYMDAGTYPIARWGIERVAGCGTPVWRFRHHDPSSLRQRLVRHHKKGCQPVVVSDGFCPACGRVAPLAEYLEWAEKTDGWLVIDDTQSLGILGSSPNRALPYGYGGGGSLRFSRIESPRVLAFSSLAKAFGAPVAVLGGSRPAVANYMEHSQTRVHCSPPSVPVLRAGHRAMALNHHCGDRLRARLLSRVRQFRDRLHQAGLDSTGGLFPVQSPTTAGMMDAVRLHESLRQHGIGAVLQKTHQPSGARVSLIITASHTAGEIDCAAAAVAKALAPRPTAARWRSHFDLTTL